ncbi:MAG: hypothetical protein AAFX93_07410 [Verrucomicrobiota bacterium]
MNQANEIQELLADLHNTTRIRRIIGILFLVISIGFFGFLYNSWRKLAPPQSPTPETLEWLMIDLNNRSMMFTALMFSSILGALLMATGIGMILQTVGKNHVKMLAEKVQELESKIPESD